jgi:hypothetical protein
MNSPETAAHLRAFEQRLLERQTRGDAAALSALLHEDFVEFGSSGRVFDKKSIIAALRQESPLQFTMTDFRCVVLASDAALVTYRLSCAVADGATTRSLRSSMWRLVNGTWQLQFHQGTRVETS